MSLRIIEVFSSREQNFMTLMLFITLTTGFSKLERIEQEKERKRRGAFFIFASQITEHSTRAHTGATKMGISQRIFLHSKLITFLAALIYDYMLK